MPPDQLAGIHWLTDFEPVAPPGGAFRPERDLAAEAYAGGAPSGTLRPPVRPIIPGDGQFHDADRARHGRWGDGVVFTSKLARSDEDASVGRKTMLASLANLDVIG